VELLFDGYDIPDKYVVSDNRILCWYPKIYKKLGERGDIALIKKVLKLYGDYNLAYVVQGAAKGGHFDILKWVIKNYVARHHTAVTGAIYGNRIDILKWLLKHGWEPNSHAVSHAAKRGHLHIVKSLVDRKWAIFDAGYHAASKGHFDIVKYLFSVDPDSIETIAAGAVKGGYLEILKFVYDSGGKLSYSFICSHLHIFEWLISNGFFEYDMCIIQNIASTGNLECLQFLHSKNYEILNARVFSSAVYSKNIMTIEWLHNLGCPMDEFAINNAINLRAPIAILKLLISWGCKIPSNGCSIAAGVGNLEMLQFLYAHNCLLDEYTITWAACNGHLDIIIWCRQQGCKWNALACQQSVQFGDLDVLKWLRGIDRDICALGSDETDICPWDDNVCLEAIKFHRVDMLKFALENGCELNSTVYDKAIRSKNSDIVDCVKKYSGKFCM
jgi:hypothetical protein